MYWFCAKCGAYLVGAMQNPDLPRCPKCHPLGHNGEDNISITEIQQVLNIVESLDVRMDRMEALMEPKPRTRDDAIGCEPNWLWFPPTVIGRGESAAMADDVFGPGKWERYGLSQIRRKPTVPEFPTDSTLGAVDDFDPAIKALIEERDEWRRQAARLFPTDTTAEATDDTPFPPLTCEDSMCLAENDPIKFITWWANDEHCESGDYDGSLIRGLVMPSIRALVAKIDKAEGADTHGDLMDQIASQRECIENLRNAEVGLKSRIKESNRLNVNLSLRLHEALKEDGKFPTDTRDEARDPRPYVGPLGDRSLDSREGVVLAEAPGDPCPARTEGGAK